MCPVVKFAAKPESRQVLAKRQIGPGSTSYIKYVQRRQDRLGVCLPTKKDDMEHRRANTRHTYQ